MVTLMTGGTAYGGYEAARVRPLAGNSGAGFIRAGIIGATAANDAQSIACFSWKHQLADNPTPSLGVLRQVGGGLVADARSGCWSGCGKDTTL